MTSDEHNAGWWGRADFAIDEARRWRIGPLHLTIARRRSEWRVAAAWIDEPEGDEHDWHLEAPTPMPDESDHTERYLVAETSGSLFLRPVAADRPVVTSPRMPMYLMPGERTTLYVGSPLWVRIETGDPQRLLTELPIRRPSDTWFGSTPREGELCYATRTRAVLEPENLPRLSRRAMTPVEIHNRAGTRLQVERLKLPVPYLAVHEAPDGLLWTPAVTMTRDEETEWASFRVHDGPPEAARAGVLLTDARTQPAPALLIRAFSNLLGLS